MELLGLKRYVVPITTEGTTVLGLVDSGLGQTFLQEQSVASGALRGAE